MNRSNEIYFLGRNKKVYSGSDIIQAVKIITNKNISTNDEIRKHVNTCCAGIYRELDTNNIKDLLIIGANLRAMLLYKEKTNKPIKDCALYIKTIEYKIQEEGIM